jgi:hypothetical protein
MWAKVNEFAELFVIQKAPGQKISPLFTKIVQGRFATLESQDQEKFRDALRRYISQYSFISQIISWIDPELEKFYLFTKLLLKYLPPKKDTLPEEILDMVDMDKFRLQELENGSIILNADDAELQNVAGDGHRPSAKPIKEQLEIIVQDLNVKHHFDFEDRDKVMRIVIPKLANDEGLIAAFQTNNLETLRRQKFAESLETAFISSAGDFYTVLNRMSEEPDFKRLLTEFALLEFRRGLAGHEAPAKKETTVDPVIPLMKRSASYVAQQFGNDSKWKAINSALWSAVSARPDHALTITEVDSIAKIASTEPSDVLAVLALLSRPNAALLEMEYLGDGGTSPISKDEVISQLRSWWKNKTLSDEDWRSWASRVVVKWRPVTQTTIKQ